MAKIPLCQVLEEEYVRLHGPLPDHYRRGADDGQRLAAICRLIHELPQKRAALCLSGGGIRSATFGLGVLQGLAARGLLGKFDYLSTVSGGGYIGSWLTAWVHHHRQGIQGVSEDLPRLSTAKLDPEPAPVRHLRAYSNYITPRLGLLSADTWTIAATYLRNLLLNWLVLIPLLAAVLMIPRLGVAVVRARPEASFLMDGRLRLAAVVIGFLSAALAIAYISVNLPSASGVRGSQDRVLRVFLRPLVYLGDRLQANRDQAGFLWWGLLPLGLSAFSLAAYWAWLRNAGSPPPDLPVFLQFGVLLHLTGWVVYAVRLGPKGGGEKIPDALWKFLIVLITGAAGGFLTWWAATKFFPNPDAAAEYYVCLAVPLLLLLFLLAGALLVGLLSRVTDDDDREWWARSSAWVLVLTVGWGVLSLLVIAGPTWLLRLPKTITSLGGLSGLITILLGRSAKTPANQRQEAKAGWPALAGDMALKFAAPLFAVFLVVVLSLGTSWLIAWVAAEFSFGVEGIDRPRVSHPFVRVPQDLARDSWNPRDYSPFTLLGDHPPDHLLFDHRRITLHTPLRLVTPLFL
ncbi:MAG TPA: patatin-like phospholipase family protein, partial [Candidatus Binatia bacterium]|nr:patatin-like phospholipase family protein [Candidatus Binatia bacterium]